MRLAAGIFILCQVLSAQTTATDPSGNTYAGGPNWIEKMASDQVTMIWRKNLDQTVGAVALDRAGNVWVGGVSGTSGVISQFEPNSGAQIASATVDRPVTALAFDPDGFELYAGAGLVTKVGGWTVAAPGSVFSLAVDGSGFVLLGGDGYVAKLSPDGAKFEWITWLSSPPASTKVRAIGLRADGGLYIAGSTTSSPTAQPEGFVNQISPTGKVVWSNKLPSPADSVRSDMTGNVILGGESGGARFTTGFDRADTASDLHAHTTTPATLSLTGTPNPATYGQSVHLALSATPNPPSGSAPIVVSDGGIPVAAGLLNSSGQATLSTASLSTGHRNLRTNPYNPNSASYTAASGSFTQTVQAAPVVAYQGSYTSAGSTPWNIATADFNGDGKADFAVANVNNGVTVFLGNGSGGFTQSYSLNPGDQVIGIATGDFNNDGVADLALANSENGSITVLLGNGTGTFRQAPGSPMSLAIAPQYLAVADLNNDGYEDLVLADPGSTNVLVLLGNGTGGFTSAGLTACGMYPSAIAAGDFDGDGKPDIAIVGEGPNSLSVLLGSGSGGFSSVKNTGLIINPYELVVADFDGDGKQDLAIIGNEWVVLLRGDGTGGFSSFSGSPINTGSLVDLIAAPDLNGDGVPDLAIVLNNSQVLFLLNNGSASFSTASFSGATVGSGPTGLAIADFDGDGAPDLAVTNFNANSATLLLSKATSTVSLASSQNPATYGSSVMLTASVVPAVTGGSVTFYDGVTILATIPLTAGTASLPTTQLASGTHTLSAYYSGFLTLPSSKSTSITQTVTALAATGGFTTSNSTVGAADAYQVVTADMNGDGIGDLISVNRSANTVSVWLGNGSGGFTQSSSAATGSSPTSVTVADFNRDGRPDLAVSNSGSNNVTVLLQNSNGTFTAASGSPLAVGGQPQYIVSGDFNGDGLMDLAVANFQSSSNSVSLFLGYGTGLFTQPGDSPVAVGSNPWFIAVGDFNGNGTAELAVANGGSGTVSLLLTTGLGSSVGVGSSARSIATGYFNSDSRLDMAVANFNDNTVDILLQNSTGTGFTSGPTLTLPSGSNPWTVVSCDFNGDGKTDLAVSAYSSNQVFVYLGNGDGTFSAAPGSPFAVGSGPGSLVMGDFIGNGVPSLAVASQNGSSITLLSGLPTATVSLKANVSTVTLGSSVMLTANVSPTSATGLVAFCDGVNILGYGTLSGGTATASFISLSAGSHTLTARYLGDSSNGASTSSAVAETVTSSTLDGLTAKTSGAGTAPQNAAVGDFNGDGIADYATSDTNSNTVSVYLGNGDGTFRQASGSPISSSGPQWVSVGDFNRDGKQDLAVVSYTGSLSVLLGNGDGTFNPGAGGPFSAGASPYAMAVADLNGDGIQDLAVSHAGASGGISILLGDGTGKFTVGTPVNFGSYTNEIAVADLNGDGKADLVVSVAGNNTFEVLLGNGQGGFTASAFAYSDGVSGVAVADFDGDGKADIAVGGNTTIGLFQGNGSGGFTQFTGGMIAVSNGGFALTTGDFNGDGKTDLAFISGAETAVLVYLNGSSGVGNASFAAAPYSPFNTGVNGPSSLVVANFNGGGLPGLITANSSTNNVSVLLNQTPGTLAFTTQPPSSAAPGATLSPVAVTVEDSSGNVVPGSSAAVTISSSPSGVGGTLTVNAVNGVATFGNLSFSSAGSFTLTAASTGLTSAVSGSIAVAKKTPTITWATPAGITYGTALSATQLNATASVPGTFVYSPAAGTVLTVGSQSLSVTFTPTDSTDYTTATAGTTITVGKAAPTITWNAPSAITYGTALSATQLNAVASVPGTYVYNPAAGTVLTAGSHQLAVSFTPTDTTDYTTAAANTTISVGKATPTITWSAPAAIAYGTALSSLQLNAAASVPGTFFYSPSAGTVLTVGNQTLSVSFTPTDAIDYTSATGTTTVVVGKATPAITLSSSLSSTAFGGLVTLTATAVPSTATGHVTFFDGVHLLGYVPLTSGVATLGAISLTPGSHSVSANYAGDANNVANGSNRLTQTATASQGVGFVKFSPTSLGATYFTTTGSFTNNGQPYVVALSNSSNQVAVYGANYTAVSGSPYSTGNAPTSVALVDVNGDGFNDMVITNYGDNTLTVLLSTHDAGGNLTGFSPLASGPISVGNQPDSVAAGDFNGDGIPDLAVTSFGASVNGLTILLGNGSGGFTQAATPMLVGGNPWFVTVADFNSDGIADLAVANGSTNNVAILLGKGDGTFNSSTSVHVGSSARSIAVADFNGDGQPDLAVANYNDNTVTVFLQNIGPGFTEQPVIALPSGTNPWTVAAGDFNGDGNTDLAVSGFGGNQVFTFLGNGSGGFTAGPGSPFSVNAGPGSLAIADFNGDGTADIVISSQNGSGLTVLQGQKPGALLFSVQPQASVTRGVTLSGVSVQVQDVFRNVVTAWSTPITISSSPAGVSGTLAVNASNGVASFNDLSFSAAGTYTLTAASSGVTSAVSFNVQVVASAPVITWNAPAGITYGTALSATQLNATASVPGSFVYSPAAGTVPTAGVQTLSVTFTPTDTTDYSTATASTTITVGKATPAITWNAPASIAYGTALSSAQLNAAVSVPGTFVYTPAAGTAPTAGVQTLSVTFTPTDTNDYSTATASTTITVGKATPSITWNAPAGIAYGTALSATQLNATASVPGTLVYTPAAGTAPTAGVQTLSVTFTPTDTNDYNAATATTSITVGKATPAITWNAPASIAYGTALSSAQLNATVSVPGTFVYSPAAGTVLTAGTQTLLVTFTPTDGTDYNTATASTTITVGKATPTITWNAPAGISYGTALSATQLNATASVPGTFVYSPAAGTVFTAGTQTLSVTFTPTDTTDYSTATANTSISVGKVTPAITWNAPLGIAYGTPLSATQLNATASVPGTFAYSPAAGTVLTAGKGQTLSVSFTPTDASDYNTVTASTSISVMSATPAITWANPVAIAYGTPLSSTQLNATANVAGTFAYTPAAGTVLPAGSGQTLSVTFTPTDGNDYNKATATATIAVLSATPVITWPAPMSIPYGTPLSSAQLNATASVPGTFAYTPAAGTVLPAGSGQTLSVIFTPADGGDYSKVSASTTITVTAATQQPTDVSSQVGVTSSGLVYSRATGAYSGTVTIQNTGSTAIGYPIQAVFTNLISGATLVNASGTYAGAPYITVAGTSLAPGASVGLAVKFTYTGTSPISYVLKTLSGGF